MKVIGHAAEQPDTTSSMACLTCSNSGPALARLRLHVLQIGCTHRFATAMQRTYSWASSLLSKPPQIAPRLATLRSQDNLSPSFCYCTRRPTAAAVAAAEPATIEQNAPTPSFRATIDFGFVRQVVHTSLATSTPQQTLSSRLSSQTDMHQSLQFFLLVQGQPGAC